MAVARGKTVYACQSCGYESLRWLGKCPGCSAWNTLTSAPAATVEEGEEPRAALAVTEVPLATAPRLRSGIGEFDRVLGGGAIPGSLVLIGGDPGVGKSTLLLQAAGAITQAGDGPVLYVSGEESPRQLRMRAERLGALHGELLVSDETSTTGIERLCSQHHPRLIVVDSAQTVRNPDTPFLPGNPVQIREVAAALLALAKTRDVPVFLVGHVTKSGLLAGPRLLEHTVDVVLLFEGERFSPFRLLRSLKNRFGSTQELGVFQMDGDGLQEVANPSQVFLAERATGAPGSVVTASLEGSRPLLCEVQALLSGPAYGSPRRTASGFEVARLGLLLAVLERRCGLRCGQLDAYIKVAGGVRLEEPAADLGLALALGSAYLDRAVAADTLVCGEVGLGGEVRAVPRLGERLHEAARLGFRRAVVPGSEARQPAGVAGMELIPVRTLREAIQQTLGRVDLAEAASTQDR